MTYPSDDSNDYTFIDIINELLKASGCLPLYTDRYGKFTITLRTDPKATTPLFVAGRTRTAFNPDFARTEMVVSDGATYTNDLWNVPNQFVFIQSGLTFDPVEGSGQFTINNSISDPTHYRPGSDQETIGRIIRSVQHLSASGQTDLVTQGEAIYADRFATVETISLRTAPWPCAGHLDVFRYCDDKLPRTPLRKVQAKSWDLTLTGLAEMNWGTAVVSDS
jgi:hypothetical protein